MGKAKAQSPRAPRPFGYEWMMTQPLHAVVDALGIDHRSRAAYWRLVEVGELAIPAVRAGLRSDDPAVRRSCCEFLDLYWDEDAAIEVESLLADPEPEVRAMAAHALSCERCKTDTWAKRARG
jgi:hypothetical protein